MTRRQTGPVPFGVPGARGWRRGSAPPEHDTPGHQQAGTASQAGAASAGAASIEYALVAGIIGVAVGLMFAGGDGFVIDAVRDLYRNIVDAF